MKTRSRLPSPGPICSRCGEGSGVRAGSEGGPGRRAFLVPHRNGYRGGGGGGLGTPVVS
jgi:hypothetical protein